MIKYFTVENFRSIKNENILEFDANTPENSDFVSNPVIGFAGANASGKTTILQALTFAVWFMRHSFSHIEGDSEIPIETFCTRGSDPISFHLIFAVLEDVNGQPKYVDYEYELQLTSVKVIYERLRYAPVRKGRWRNVYTRTEQKIKFGGYIKEIQTVDLRPNSSIVSFAAQYESQKEAKICQNYNAYSNVSVRGYQEVNFGPNQIGELLDDIINQDRLQEFLQIADVGIRDVVIQQPDRDELLEILQFLEKNSDNVPPKQIEKFRTLAESGRSDESNVPSRAIFKHYIDGTVMDFDTGSESSGTQRFLAILYLILNALKNGDVIILDEIELKLHQNLVAYLIGLFQNKYENKNGSQLFFSFHNTYLMDILSPEQLWFAEKNKMGHTELFSAIDFEDLHDIQQQSLEKLYRIGRFGATPRGI